MQSMVIDMKDIIAADAEYLSLAKKLYDYSQWLGAAITGYENSVNYAAENGVRDQAIQGELLRYAGEAGKARQQTEDLILELSCLTGSYLSEIDKADNILY